MSIYSTTQYCAPCIYIIVAQREKALLCCFDFLSLHRVLLSGFDGMASDPLGGQLGLVVEDYAWATHQIVRAAAESPTCRGRVVSVLEGGYDIARETSGLAQAVQAHVRELMRAGEKY